MLLSKRRGEHVVHVQQAHSVTLLLKRRRKLFFSGDKRPLSLNKLLMAPAFSTTVKKMEATCLALKIVYSKARPPFLFSNDIRRARRVYLRWKNSIPPDPPTLALVFVCIYIFFFNWKLCVLYNRDSNFPYPNEKRGLHYKYKEIHSSLLLCSRFNIYLVSIQSKYKEAVV